MAAVDWASVENAVASVAIIVGGLWASWKWGYGETLRKRREYSDLDGALTAASVTLPGGKAYLTLQAVWRNPGPGPVKVCLEHTFVEQYQLGTDPPLGSLRMAGYPGAVKIATVPMDSPGYMMGPQTESVMTEHFAVEASSVYAFAWQVCQGPLSRGDQRHGSCSRELIWGPSPADPAGTAHGRPVLAAGSRRPRTPRPKARRGTGPRTK